MESQRYKRQISQVSNGGGGCDSGQGHGCWMRGGCDSSGRGVWDGKGGRSGG